MQSVSRHSGTSAEFSGSGPSELHKTQSANLGTENVVELEDEDGNIASANMSETVEKRFGPRSQDLAEDDQESNPESVEQSLESTSRNSRVDMSGAIDD